MVNYTQNYMYKQILEICGIYQIKNQINGKIYIGSSIKIKTRCRTHYNNLLKGKHVNKRLQNSWNKHNEINFEFSIIEIVNDKTKLLEREQYHIDFLKPEYNICKIAGNTLGVKPSNKIKKKISDTLSDKFSGINSFNYKGGYVKPKNKLESNLINEKLETSNSRQSIKSGKIIYQYDSNMILINEFPSIKKASDICKISRASIKRCCDGKDRHAGFFIWRFKGSEDIIHEYRIKEILQIDENNKIINKFNQIVIAAETLKINRKYISLAIKSGKTYCGFYWKYNN